VPDAPLAIPVDNSMQQLRFALTHQGFCEIITYSFVDSTKQMLLNPDVSMKELANPIAANMNAMRTNLWPGLIETVRYNQHRQQDRTHLFEIGTVFIGSDEKQHLGGIMSGLVQHEQWGLPDRTSDFFDLKGQVENVLSLYAATHDVSFTDSTHAALHPGQQAEIKVAGQVVGVMGKLHPRLMELFDLSRPVYLFEIFLDQLLKLKSKIKHTDLSKFPEVRRDIAILLDRTIPCAVIQDTIKSIAGDWLKAVFLFDVYEGDKIPLHLKSLAYAIYLQAQERTLVDEEVTALMDKIIAALKESYGAELRS
jgi:phenylalanyl-tRNA synthetase beta chain